MVILSDPTVEDYPFMDCGAECMVYEHDDPDWLIKTFRTMDEAESAFRRQEYAANCKCGPAIDHNTGVFRIGPITIGMGDYVKTAWHYAYLTERVEICDEYDDGKQEWYEFESKLESNGISRRDMCIRNAGRLEDGTLVKLDFGNLSS